MRTSYTPSLISSCIAPTMIEQHRWTSSTLLAFGAVVAALICAPMLSAQAVTDGDTASLTPAMISVGRKIFHGQGNCATCHGQALEGTPMAPTLKAHEWRDAKGGGYAALVGVILNGASSTAMVSHPGGISSAQAKKVAAYIWAVNHRGAKT